MLLTLPLLLFGCPDPNKDLVVVDSGDSGGDSGADSGDSGTGDSGADSGDTGADSGDTGADSGDSGGDSGDTGTVREGLRGRYGDCLTDTTTLSGSEDWYFIGDEGDGEDVCRIRLTFGAATPDDGCKICDWAFAIEVDAAEIVAESDVGCLPTMGLDAAGVEALVGTSVYRGYIGDYYGHAQVLAVDEGAGWAVVSFAAWDDSSGVFTYDWVDGLANY